MKKRLQSGFGIKLIDRLGRYKYVSVAILLGLLLLLIPAGNRKAATASEGFTGEEENFSVDALEEKLAHTLSKVSGAGNVSVVLTVRSGMERILATDGQRSQSGGNMELEQKTVVISTDDGDEVVLIRQNYPIFQGALIVCSGGDDPQVRLTLTNAVAALTGLSTGRITVCRGS